ncbi:putative chemotaxis transducer [Devosia sp. LC5]|uniref:methyl-accepting chemotaxis protein n=1 Tax=Devosia sp. LC5 TaxID=1502724 RepID=UPI0004E30ACF|nr:methyl-accepting chemotaxis protein [Devosia sp. LC5]KFC68425.1 putative chemotaxis transducer [Devosia sp. LC5]
MNFRSLSVKTAILSGLALAIVFAIGIFVLVQQVGQTIDRQTRAYQAASTAGVADEVAASLSAAAATADGVVTALESLKEARTASRSVYGALLQHTLKRNPSLLGVWSGWEPNALDGRDVDFANRPGHDATGRYVPYWNRGSGEIANEPLTGYDDPVAGAYYQRPKAEGRMVAIDPYLYAVGGKDVLIMSFGAPIMVGGTYMGTGGVDLSLAELNARLAEIKPMGTGTVVVLTAAGMVVAHPDPTLIGQTLPASDPLTGLAAAAIANGTAEADLTSTDGTALRGVAVPFAVGGTLDRWVVVSNVPLATLTATQTETQFTIIGLAAACVLIACLVMFALIRTLIGKPLGTLGATVDAVAGGDYHSEINGIERADEIGTLARAVEIFRDNGLKISQMTEEERAAVIQRRVERTDMMVALQAAFGEVVDAAIAGDFSKRVHAQFPDAELNALAGSVNALVETVDRGLGETGAVLAAMADTDLTRRMQGNYSGAFAKLRDDTNAVTDRLTEIVGGAKAISGTLRAATSEILSGANDLSERTTKQAATIEETSAAMEQLAATVAENAKMAETASGKAQTVSTSAAQSGNTMDQANAAMERITEASSKISNIIGMIDDIAFQTNLLALNASVEAARAGDAGKGFAVVAVEVRRLAQSAASASADVKHLVEQSASEVRGGTKLVSNAAEQLASMLAAVDENARLMQAIAKSSLEQAAAIGQVNVAVRTLDEMTQHNAALVEEMNAAIEQSENQASQLDMAVDVFTLEPSSAEPAQAKPRRAVPPSTIERVRSASHSYLSQGGAAIAKDWSEF